jgi:hypothetical protein
LRTPDDPQRKPGLITRGISQLILGVIYIGGLITIFAIRLGLKFIRWRVRRRCTSNAKSGKYYDTRYHYY